MFVNVADDFVGNSILVRIVDHFMNHDLQVINAHIALKEQSDLGAANIVCNNLLMLAG